MIPVISRATLKESCIAKTLIAASRKLAQFETAIKMIPPSKILVFLILNPIKDKQNKQTSTIMLAGKPEKNKISILLSSFTTKPSNAIPVILRLSLTVDLPMIGLGRLTVQ